MSNREDRYAERAYLNPGDVEISPEAYNLVIGGTLLYGFLVNCFMVKFCYNAAYNIIANNYILFLIGYVLFVIAGSFLIRGSQNPVVSFIGYNMIVLPIGLILSVILNDYISAGYSSTITAAFALTAIITLAMMAISSFFPDMFLSMGRTLMVTLLVTLIMEVILFLLHAPLQIFDYIVVLLFSGYIGYDWARANCCAKTVDNAIDCASELYLDMINLFLRLLRILARSQNN